MKISDYFQRAQQLYRSALLVMRLPTARLRFEQAGAADEIRKVYQAFNRRHARFLVIRNKTLGIALIDLSNFNSPDEYTDTVKKKDYAAFHARNARKRGYTVRAIDRNDFIDQIFDINISSDIRQGRPMDQAYLIRQTHYEEKPPYKCFGVFDKENQLVGYCNVGFFGNFASTDRLLGYKRNDGAMYLLLVDIICVLIKEYKLDYFMYDTYLGAQPGLQHFKQRIGFAPYRVSYAIA